MVVRSIGLLKVRMRLPTGTLRGPGKTPVIEVIAAELAAMTQSSAEVPAPRLPSRSLTFVASIWRWYAPSAVVNGSRPDNRTVLAVTASTDTAAVNVTATPLRVSCRAWKSRELGSIALEKVTSRVETATVVGLGTTG